MSDEVSDHPPETEVSKGVTESAGSSNALPAGKFWAKDYKPKKQIELVPSSSFLWTPYVAKMDGKCKSDLNLRTGSGKPAPFT